MGTWGVGNFEDDSALNVLAMWINKIVADIQETFTYDSVNSLYDSDGESDIVANVDIFGTLLEKYRFYTDVEISEIQNWKNDYLATFDRTTDIYAITEEAVEFDRQRRIVIEKTFDRLINIIEKLEADVGAISGE